MRPTKTTSTSRRLSPSDPPEVFEGVLDGMGRFKAEMDKRRAAQGRPPIRELTAEESAEVRKAFLASIFRGAFRGR